MHAIAVMAISQISTESRQNGTAVVPDNSCLQRPPNRHSLQAENSTFLARARTNNTVKYSANHTILSEKESFSGDRG